MALRYVLTAYGFARFAASLYFFSNTKMARLVGAEGLAGRHAALRITHRKVVNYLDALVHLGLVHICSSGSPASKPCIVVANHPSLLDFIILLRAYPNAVCLYKRDSLRNPVLRSFLRYSGYIEAMDGSASSNRRVLANCQKRLSEGHTVVIFPEGTRSPSSTETRRFRKTAFHAAIKCDVPIQPVAVFCNPLFLGKGQPWREFCRTRNTVYINFLKEFPTSDPDVAGRGAGALAARVQRCVEQELASMAARCSGEHADS